MERRICHNDGVSPVLDGRLFFNECMSLSEKCYSFPITRIAISEPFPSNS
ncbi:MAG: hypothetical protein J6T03_07715 [Bacteroidales bacterium]|nr:hypothetical protein [Bacteroidales bacterium]